MKPRKIYTDDATAKAHPGHGGVAWNKLKEQNKGLKQQVADLEERANHFQFVAKNGFDKIERLNSELTELSSSEVSEPEPPVVHPPPVDGNKRDERCSEIEMAIKNAVKGSDPIPSHHLGELLKLLGLDEKGHATDEAKQARLEKGIMALLGHHFGEGAKEAKRARIIAR